MTGLMRNTPYFVRAYASADTSTYYGNTLNFTTTYTPGKYFVSTVAGTGKLVSPMAISPSLPSKAPSG